MNEQDQKTLYTAFVLLGLLTRGTPVNAIAPLAKNIVQEVMNESDSNSN